MPRGLLFILIAIGTLLLVFFLFKQFPYALDSEFARADAVYLTLFLIPILASGIARYAGQGRQMLRDGAIWLGVVAFIIIGYSYRDVVMQSRLMRELFPSRIQVASDGSLRLRADRDGHFFLEARVNNQPIRFMVDTGASNVVLTKKDAARIGIDVESLHYDGAASTANGIVRTARTTLGVLEAGPVVAYDFPAHVNDGRLDVSLLGMAFLKEFASMRIVGHTLILEP